MTTPISHDFTIIYSWINPIVSEYVNLLTPQLSDTWHADELFVKMNGSQTYKGKQKPVFLWNVMDRKTSFLLASKVSEDRDISSTVAVFTDDVKNANGQNPKEIHTDALRTYREGVSQNFSNNNTAAVALDE